MKQNRIKKIVLIILICVGIVIFLISIINKGNNKNHSIQRKTFYETEMENELTNIGSSTGAYFIKLSEFNNKEFTFYYIPTGAKFSFGNNAEIGDSIIKDANSFKLLLKTKGGKEHIYDCYK